MTIVEYVKSVDLNTGVDILSDRYKNAQQVYTQASRHCTRSDLSEFYNIVRPNEEKVYTDWRNDNKRLITAAPILAFKMMLTRVLKSSIRLPELDKELFDNIDDFLFEEIIRLSLLDTNTIGIEWPYSPDNPDVPLAIPGAHPQNKPFETSTVLYHFDKVVIHNENFIVLADGTMMVGSGDNKKEAKKYIAADKVNYYKILPREKKDGEKSTIVYEVVTWYFHNLQRIPVFDIPGIPMQGNYKESVAWGAYEYLDEAIIALSSDQINRIRHALPTLVVNAEISCPKCNGARLIDGEACGTCNGAGHLKEIGDFGTLRIRNKSEFDRANTNPVHYVQTSGDLSYTFKVWENLIDKAEKQLCTDLLEGSGTESGIAKELRLEPRQDILVMYGEQFCRTVEAYINNRIQLRNIQAEFHTIVPPSYYQTKTPDMLRLYVTQSLPAERQREYMLYIKSKYRGNDFMIDVHMKAMWYAPLLLYTQDEADKVIAMGAYDANDIKRRDYAIIVISEILEKEPEVTRQALFEKVDALLVELGILDPPQLTIDGEDVIQSENKLLQTVGGVTSIVEISRAVTAGEMTEKSAENLLMTVFKLSAVEAAKLIDKGELVDPTTPPVVPPEQPQ